MQLTVKRLVLAGISLPFLLLLILALVREPMNRKLNTESKAADRLLSVSVGKKGVALAAMYDASYQIVYESAPTLLARCDPVLTTGLEQYTDADIKLGYIAHVRPSTSSRYLEIMISSENPCARS